MIYTYLATGFAPSCKKSIRKKSAMEIPALNEVWFDVGGQVWAFPASMLDNYPSTRLAKFQRTNLKNKALLVGDDRTMILQAVIDNGYDGYEDEFIPFIDGDPDRFEYVLDYMSRNSDPIFIPNTISKHGLLIELEMYGFDDVDPSAILVKGQKVTHSEHLESISTLESQLITTLLEVKEGKFDNLEENLERMLDQVHKRKRLVENEEDAGPSTKEKSPGWKYEMSDESSVEDY